jgi:hypothetical protein
MQKLKGISSGQNNKSCGIIRCESNKIGLTFFWCFCDFLRKLQVSAKSQVLFKNHFARRSLETSGSYEHSLAFAVGPLKLNGASQCDPWAAGRRGSGRNPATGGAGVRGRRWGKTQGSPRGWFACSEGVGRAAGGAYRGSRRRPPLELLLRRGGETSGVTKGGWSFYGV